MTLTLASQICALLATMKGYPSWPAVKAAGEITDMDQAYYAGIQDLSDAVGTLVRDRLLLTFDERPSVKVLRDWAVSLAPAPVFRLETLPGSVPTRLTGPKMASVAEALSHAPPPAVREVFAALRRPASAEGGPSSFGLQFRDRKTGRISRTAASSSERSAQAKADARNERWPHVETTVYRKGDPLPAQARDQNRQEKKQVAA